jgi:hypothetical protein
MKGLVIIKCVICGEEAEYVQSGMSLCEKHFKAQQIETRDIDLVKIQIYADKCHTSLAFGLSFAAVLFGFAAVFVSLYYQSLMQFNTLFAIVGDVGMVAILSSSIIVAGYSRQKYQKDSERIANMLEAVKEGKQLPILNELDEWKKEEKT